MKPLPFRMNGGNVHRNAKFRLRLPEGQRSKSEKIIGEVFYHILSHHKCRCNVDLDVSVLQKDELHLLQELIQAHDPRQQWDVEQMTALDYYRIMSGRQRQVFLLIPPLGVE